MVPISASWPWILEGYQSLTQKSLCDFSLLRGAVAGDTAESERVRSTVAG